jgi:hypothetical protein
MEPVTPIMAALTAGATAGTLEALEGDAREQAVAAYARLRGLVERRVSGRPHAELALAEYGAAPQKWEGLLVAELTEAGAASDEELLAAANAFMELVGRAVVTFDKLTMTVEGAAGVHIGYGSTQIVHISPQDDQATTGSAGIRIGYSITQVVHFDRPGDQAT